MSGIFKTMSEPILYDIFNINCVEDIEMYKILCSDINEVLELGVGTGRVAIPLAQNGINVFGIDNSLPMLQLLEAKINDNKISGITLCHQDIRSLSLKKDFETILCPFCMFNFLLSIKDQERALLSISKLMNNKSKIIFDLLTINTFSDALYDNSLKHFSTFKSSDESSMIEIYTSNTFYQQTQIFSQERFFRKYDHNNVFIEEIHTNMKNRFFFLGEFKLLLDKCGYKILNIYGNYKLSSYSKDSQNLIVVATLK